MALRAAPKDDAQLELFSAIFTDIATRDARDAMELPFLNLSKKPRFEPIRLKAEHAEVVVTGGKPYGIANIWDWDLILWLLSQLRQALDRGESPSRKVRFHRRDFLKAARRGTGGRQYRALEESILRLSNTNVFTTVCPGEGRRTVKFTWIEYAEMERDEQGRIEHAVVVLPEWLHRAVCDSRRVLTLHRDYFLLTGGLERWFYRLIRKGAGKGTWRWKLRTLHERSGSLSEYKSFARDMRRIAARKRLLGYEVSFEKQNGDVFVRARKRGEKPVTKEKPRAEGEGEGRLTLRHQTYAEAKVLAPGYDIYALEADWLAATRRNGAVLRDPDRAFLAWCREVHKRKPLR